MVQTDTPYKQLIIIIYYYSYYCYYIIIFYYDDYSYIKQNISFLYLSNVCYNKFVYL